MQTRPGGDRIRREADRAEDASRVAESLVNQVGNKTNANKNVIPFPARHQANLALAA
jgi:hypothetical protein